ncbi:hypothetical protein S40285_07887, partial [Stachybotrys chlorohalonatus IBT 40285]
TWLRWYKKPEYRDIKQYSTEVTLGKRSISPDGRNRGLIPSHLSLDRVLANKTCSPMSLSDFYMYLKYIEYSPENLEFYIWFKNYEARWQKHSSSDNMSSTRDDHSFAQMSQIHDSQDESQSQHNLSAEDYPEAENESQAAAQILEFALPSAPCPFIERPKPSARDRFTSFKNACVESTKLTCKIGRTPNFGMLDGFDAAEELESIIQLYLLPSSPKELNIPPAIRDSAIEAIQTSTNKDPRHLAPIATHVFALLRTCSHPNFLRLGVANGTLETVCVVTSAGIAMTCVGFLLVFLRAFVPFTGAHSRLELLGPWGFWFLGLSFVLSGMRGSCFFLLLFSRRQPLPWERFDDRVSIRSNRSRLGKLIKRVMIFDRKLRVKDVHLRQLQRKIVIQSLLGGAMFATLGVLVFVFQPIWRETVHHSA